MGKRDGLYLRGSIWWMRKDPVTGREASTRCRDLGAARLVRAARERGAADPAYATALAATVGSECRRLLDARAALGKTPRFYEQKLGHWARIIGNDFPILQVGPGTFDRFVAARRAEGVTDHTISKEVRCMLTALRLSKRLGCFQGDLSVLRPMGLSSGYEPRTRALSADELLALLRQLHPERWAFVALVVGLGLRRGEALALRAEHVDLDAGVVRVPGTKTLGARRTIPVLAPFSGLVESAARWLPLPSWGNYLRDLGAACARANIARCTANDLRRTHATLLRQAGVDRDVARRLLGHTPGSPLLEVVYDQPTPRELATRAGDLTTLTRQLSAPPSPKQHYHRPIVGIEARPPEPKVGGSNPPGRAAVFPGSPAVADPGEPPEDTESTTGTRHSLAALALALAAESALRRPRVHWVTVVRTGEGKRVG